MAAANAGEINPKTDEPYGPRTLTYPREWDNILEPLVDLLQGTTEFGWVKLNTASTARIALREGIKALTNQHTNGHLDS